MTVLTVVETCRKVDTLWNRTVDSMNLQFCSRENQLLQLLQWNEKPTSMYKKEGIFREKVNNEKKVFAIPVHEV